MDNEIKITLARQQIINGKHYAAGEHMVSEDVADQLKKRQEKRGDVLVENAATAEAPPTPEAAAVTEKTALAEESRENDAPTNMDAPANADAPESLSS